MKSKKIVMLQDFFGIDLSYQENLLTKYYIELGHEVTIISSTYESIFDYVNDKHDNTKQAFKIYYSGAKIIKLPYSINILHKLKKHAGVFEILEVEKPDLIFAHDIHLNLSDAVRYVKKNPECKIIMDYHCDYSNSGKNWVSINILHKVFRKYVLYKYRKYISRIFPIVPAGADFLHEVYGVSYKEMTLLPLGYDSLKSTEIISKADRPLIKKQFGIKEEDFVILSGGKFDPIKQTEVLIQAIENINQQDIHLIVFGKATDEYLNYENSLKNIVKNAHIHFTGWLSNDSVLELMTIADLAIFPASQSVIWQQSIGMHLPLILGDLGGQNPEYLNLHSNIILLKPHEITSKNIEKNIILLKNDPVLLKKMRNGAEKVASEYLDYRIICNTTLEALQTEK